MARTLSQRNTVVRICRRYAPPSNRSLVQETGDKNRLVSTCLSSIFLWGKISVDVHAQWKLYIIFTARVRSTTRGHVFTGVCLLTRRRGLPQSQVFSQVSGPRSFPKGGGTPASGPMSFPRKLPHSWPGKYSSPGRGTPSHRTGLGYPTPRTAYAANGTPLAVCSRRTFLFICGIIEKGKLNMHNAKIIFLNPG